MRKRGQNAVWKDYRSSIRAPCNPAWAEREQYGSCPETPAARRRSLQTARPGRDHKSARSKIATATRTSRATIAQPFTPDQANTRTASRRGQRKADCHPARRQPAYRPCLCQSDLQRIQCLLPRRAACPVRSIPWSTGSQIGYRINPLPHRSSQFLVMCINRRHRGCGVHTSEQHHTIRF